MADDILTMGVRETIAALQREQWSLAAQMRARHDALFRPYREQLKRWFLGHFTIPPLAESTRPAIPVWDALSVVRDGITGEAQAALKATFDQAQFDNEFFFEEALDEALLDGYTRELWLLAIGGIVGLDFAEELRTKSAREQIIDTLLRNIDDWDWLDNLNEWHTVMLQKCVQVTTTALVAGWTLQETIEALDRITGQFDRRTTNLLGNQRHRAAVGGAGIALGQAYDVDEVWFTADDELVCPICRPLHMTVTPLLPINDSHPGCRCWKVPIPVRFVPQDIDYQDFLLEFYSDPLSQLR